MSKYGVISGPYCPFFVLNKGKYGPEIIQYLDNFHAVQVLANYRFVFRTQTNMFDGC